jgi:hypothetical protein
MVGRRRITVVAMNAMCRIEGRVRIAAAVLLSMLLTAGCASMPTTVGPRPPADYRAVKHAEGDACGFLVLGIIPTDSFKRRTEIAYERALENGGKALTDTSIQHSWKVVPFVGFLACTHLEGKVVE